MSIKCELSPITIKLPEENPGSKFLNNALHNDLYYNFGQLRKHSNVLNAKINNFFCLPTGVMREFAEVHLKIKIYSACPMLLFCLLGKPVGK